MKTLILATRNTGKAEEIRHLFEGSAITIRSLNEFPDVPEIEETGTTLEENAILKAKTVFTITGLPALADDSGLEVIALNMAPGVISARYGGENATYADNNRKLLDDLNNVPPEKRTARFRCIAAIVGPGLQHYTEGICPGRIIDTFRGSGGFGYDPLFIPDGYTETFAELGLEVKNRISHRAKAFEAMKKYLLGITF